MVSQRLLPAFSGMSNSSTHQPRFNSFVKLSSISPIKIFTSHVKVRYAVYNILPGRLRPLFSIAIQELTIIGPKMITLLPRTVISCHSIKRSISKKTNMITSLQFRKVEFYSSLAHSSQNLTPHGNLNSVHLY